VHHKDDYFVGVHSVIVVLQTSPCNSGIGIGIGIGHTPNRLMAKLHRYP